jgi:membrane-associated phospholipid phosphatase
VLSPPPAHGLADATGGAVRREWHQHEVVREVVLAALAALAYFGIRNLTVGAADEAFANAGRLARLEERIGIAWEQTLQGWLVDHEWLVTLFNWIYIWGHWPVIITCAILLFLLRREHYFELRNAIFLSGAIGFLFFAFLPVAPPRLVDPALVDTVTQNSEAYRALQPPGLTNQFAAFPSLHFGWNLLLGIAVWSATRNPVLRALAVLGPAAMAAAVVLTANHYVIDVLAGGAVVLLALLVVRRRRLLERR